MFWHTCRKVDILLRSNPMTVPRHIFKYIKFALKKWNHNKSQKHSKVKNSVRVTIQLYTDVLYKKQVSTLSVKAHLLFKIR